MVLILPCVKWYHIALGWSDPRRDQEKAVQSAHENRLLASLHVAQDRVGTHLLRGTARDARVVHISQGFAPPLPSAKSNPNSSTYSSSACS